MHETKSQLPKHRRKAVKRSTNLYLDPIVTAKAAETASSRYGVSLSVMVEGLLRRENAQKKRGLLRMAVAA